MSDLEEQLDEFESIQSIYDSNKLSFDSKLIKQLVCIVCFFVLDIYLSLS